MLRSFFPLSKMTCKLCELPLPKNPIEEHYCCSGCLTVHKILGEANKEHPLFQEAVKAGLISNPHLVEKAGLISNPHLVEKAGIISNPHLIEEERACAERLRSHFEVRGMWCPSCAIAIRMLLMKQKGVLKAVIDYSTDLALVEYDPRQTSKDSFFDFIRRIGYEAGPLLAKPKSQFTLWLRFGFALFALLNLMMFVYPIHFSKSLEGFEKPLSWISLALATPLFALFPWRRFLLSLRTFCFGMETLVLLGISSAYFCSLANLLRGSTEIYFDSMAMVMVSVLLGKLMEQRAKFSAKETLFRATRSLPQRGRKNGTFVPIKEIEVGDALLALQGEKIVLDGEVTSGSALVNESVMTGEARLVSKKRGSRLIGGSIIHKGTLNYCVTANSENSLISHVLHFIERDLQNENYFRPIDRIIPIFVPVVILLGIVSGHLLEVLLIACPCAIGIAVPLVESRLIKRFGEEGVLIRNRNSLFRLGRDPHFVFDKTGTLTEGLFTLLSEKPTDPLIGRMAASSNHPIAQAVAEGEPLEVEEIPGRGLVYQDALLGSKRLLEERGISTPPIESEHSLLYFSKEGKCVAIMEVGDRLRDLPPLQGLLLSGDREEVVAPIAKKLGLSWKSECDPLEKREEILKIKGTTVMVGDGLNDAAALAAADVGISVTSGSDVSLQVADMVVSDLRALPKLVQLSKRGLAICRQNLFWAFSFNVVGIALAMQGLLQPLFAAAAMALSSLAVVLSTCRINKKRGLKERSFFDMGSGGEESVVKGERVLL